MSEPRLIAYRTIGPFNRASLPAGLLKEHRLKEGAWGRLSVRSGGLRFVWDDCAEPSVELVAGDTILIPPQRPHHLEAGGEFELEITFLNAQE